MGRINYGRMILGGVLAFIAIFFAGFLFHGIILRSHYVYFQKAGVVLAQPREMGWVVHIVGHLVSGLVISMAYVVARKFWSPGPMTAIRVGLIVALFTAGQNAGEYFLYNLGAMVPAMTFLDNMVGAVLGALVAGIVYKD